MLTKNRFYWWANQAYVVPSQGSNVEIIDAFNIVPEYQVIEEGGETMLFQVIC